MKKKHVGKSIISMLLVVSLVLGMIGIMPKGQEVEAADATTDTTKVLAEELEGYRRITTTDFENLSNQRLGEEYTLTTGYNQYVGNYNGKTYLDVDVNFNGVTAYDNTFLRYFGNLDKGTNGGFYYSAFMLQMYNDGGNKVELAYQNESTSISRLATILASDYGISSASAFFNVKLLTNIKQDTVDTTKEVIEYQLWINNQFVCEGSITETAHERYGVCVQTSSQAGISLRVPKVMDDEFEGYQKITVEDFEGLGDTRLTENGIDNSAGHIVGTYTGGSLDNTYLDVDAYSYSAGTMFSYLHSKQDGFYGDGNFYKFTVSGTTLTLDQVLNNSVKATKTFDLSSYGVVAQTMFNLKIRTDISEDAKTIILQLWVNDNYVGTCTFQETTARDISSKGILGIHRWVKYRTPIDYENELEGYRRVTVEDFEGLGDTRVSVAGIDNSAGHIAGTYTGGSLDNTYLDVDAYSYSAGTMFSYLHSKQDGFYGDGNFYKFTASGTTLTLDQVLNNSVKATKTFDLSSYGVVAQTMFNLKIRTDISEDAKTIILQLWVNDNYVGTCTFQETTARDISSKGILGIHRWVKYRTPIDYENELEGYRRVTVEDFEGLGDTRVSVAGIDNSAGHIAGTYTGGSLDNTYLDVDAYSYSAGTMFSYLHSKQDGFYGDGNFYKFTVSGTTLTLDQVLNNSVKATKTFDLSSYGVVAQTMFNLKIRTDISEDAKTIILQLWVNDNYVGTCTFQETTARDISSKGIMGIHRWVKYRTPIDYENELEGYKRITVEDFDGLGAARVEEGTTYVSGRAGHYSGKSLHKTYLDMDVQTSTTDMFMNYLMSGGNNGFYGDNNYYRFTLSGTSLTVLQVMNGSGKTSKAFDIANCDFKAGEMFNLKVRTDIDGLNVTLQIWINDYYLTTLVFTESAAREMDYLGIRGTDTASTIVRIPMNEETMKAESYDLSKGGYLLSGAETFYVNGKKTAAGTILNTPNDYMIERIVNGKVASTKRVSLYYVGDVNLDGSAFESGDPVWKDGYALQGILNHGTPMKAALKAADINNDGEVTEADYTEFEKIKYDVTKKEEALSAYHTEALTYDYLGGSSVMPIAGFYGPYNDANITDKVYKWIADAGINLITYSPVEQVDDVKRLQQGLALAEKYGIGMFVTDSGLNTLAKDGATVTEQTTKTTAIDIAKQMEAYSVYDSFLGINIVDEPEPLDLESENYKNYKYYNDIAEALKPYSNITGYINLNGSIAVDKGEYKSYLEEIAPDVKMLSFDNYPFYDVVGNLTNLTQIQTRRIQTYLESLDSVRQVAKDNNIPFMSYVQAGSDYRDDKSNGATSDVLSEAETQWIVNTSLAYGAKGIAWFPLLQPESFSYDSTKEDGHDYDRNGIIGADNEKNAYYTIVQKTNKQIAAIDEVLMKANNTGVIVTGKAATDVSGTSASSLAGGRGYNFTGIKEKANGTYTTQLKDVTTGDKGVMVGCFEYRDSEAFYVVNYDTTQGATQTITLTFNGSYQYRLIQDAKTTYGNGETVTLTIPAGAGVLVVLEDHIVEYTAAEFATYRTGETFTAPEAPVGYVFAGWFTNASCTSAVPMNAKTVSVAKVYAKFVDENLLNVKAQILANTERDSVTTDIRFVFAVDTLRYSKIGFLIKQGDKVRDRSNNKVYTTLSAYDEYGKTQAEFTPQNVFCETATRFKTWTITGVPNTSFETPFEVTAYWITKDGTKVCSPQATKIIFDAIQ